MTNEDLLQDLKQFITATVGQSEERLRAELRAEIGETRSDLGGRIDSLRAETETGFAAAAEATAAIHDLLEDQDERLKDHGRRIQRLEHRVA